MNNKANKMYKDNYNQISKTNKSIWLIEGGRNANKRNNIHICTYNDKDLPRGYRRIPITLCEKDKLLHIPNINKNADVNCIHYGHDGICDLHGGFCANLKPKIHHVERLKCPFCTSENTKQIQKTLLNEFGEKKRVNNECLNCGFLWDVD